MMRRFKVYQHPTNGYEAVKVGFSWPAFLFGAIWMLTKRLWGIAALWCGAFVLLDLIENVTDEAQSAPGLQAIMYLLLSAGYFALALIPAFRGNNWRSENLETRGYRLTREIEAETPDGAIAQVAGAAHQGSDSAYRA